jgi:hypothetical protein
MTSSGISGTAPEVRLVERGIRTALEILGCVPVNAV